MNDDKIFIQDFEGNSKKGLIFVDDDSDVIIEQDAPTSDITLSHGEQTKILLAILFARENHFLLIDEPTNHLDMEARDVVRDYLSGKEGFILVSHDRYFLDGCIDHILAVNRQEINIEKGNFSSWWENKQRRDIFEREIGRAHV